jgi:hypothetical protein
VPGPLQAGELAGVLRDPQIGLDVFEVGLRLVPRAQERSDRVVLGAQLPPEFDERNTSSAVPTQSTLGLRGRIRMKKSYLEVMPVSCSSQCWPPSVVLNTPPKSIVR